MICGAARTIGRGVAVCERDPSPSVHAGLDHYDPHHGVSWPVCPSHCAEAGHICGRYRLDQARQSPAGDHQHSRPDDPGGQARA